MKINPITLYDEKKHKQNVMVLQMTNCDVMSISIFHFQI